MVAHALKVCLCAEAEQLVQAGYEILAGATPRGDDAFARQFKSKDVSPLPCLLCLAVLYAGLSSHLQCAVHTV